MADSQTPDPRYADILTIGFGTTVAMWAAGYLLWLPPLRHPEVSALALLILLGRGAAVAGQITPRGWRGGLLVGLLASLLNLLVLGSLLGGRGGDPLVPSALLWLPGSLVLGAGLGALGGATGAWVKAARLRSGLPEPPPPNWTAAFCGVAATATFFLLIVGGVVTGNEAGLAVTDWPNSFGTNMFLFPLSRMTGGIYYEHAHRLFGSLVGLTTLVLAVFLQRADDRPRVRRFALLALALVIVQGVLGGLRVTGRFTLSADPADTAPSLALAVVHGVTGQLFLAALVALAAVTTTRWRAGPPAEALPAAATDRSLTRLLAAALVVQLALGAIQRHLASGLLVHVSFAVVVVALALAAGVRAWGVHERRPPLPGLGKLLLVSVGLQILLGIGALVVTGARANHPAPTAADVVVTTAHQTLGALLLVTAFLLALWTTRLLATGATTPQDQPQDIEN